MNIEKEKEMDAALHAAETMMMRNKVRCKTAEKQKVYGIAINSIHRDRPYFVQVDPVANIGHCICGEVIKLDNETAYCSVCGQKLSRVWGWTVDDYYNEKKNGIWS